MPGSQQLEPDATQSSSGLGARCFPARARAFQPSPALLRSKHRPMQGSLGRGQEGRVDRVPSGLPRFHSLALCAATISPIPSPLGLTETRGHPEFQRG